MPKKIITSGQHAAIKHLWNHHIPPKIIAEALDLKYAIVSLYCRGYKSLIDCDKLSAKDAVRPLLASMNKPKPADPLTYKDNPHFDYYYNGKWEE